MSPTKNHILIGLSESPQTKFGKEDFSSQSIAQKTFSALWEVESEVNNGGFSQYFVNSSAESAHFLVDALNMIGAPKTADICQSAIAAAFPAGLPESEEAIRSAAHRRRGCSRIFPGEYYPANLFSPYFWHTQSVSRCDDCAASPFLCGKISRIPVVVTVPGKVMASPDTACSTRKLFTFKAEFEVFITAI